MDNGKKFIRLAMVCSFVAIAILFFRTSRETVRTARHNMTKHLTVAVYSIDKAAVNGRVIEAENASAGTGFVVGRNGYILSAAHIIGENGPQVFIIELDNRYEKGTVEARLLAVDTENDLAAYRIDHRFISEIPIGDNQFEPWEKVYSYNCLHNACGSYTEGNYITHGKNTAFPELDKTILFNMFIAEGASGGGIFDAGGNLVSMVRLGFVADKVPHVLNSATLGPDAETIHHFLTINRIPHRHH